MTIENETKSALLFNLACPRKLHDANKTHATYTNSSGEKVIIPVTLGQDLFVVEEYMQYAPVGRHK